MRNLKRTISDAVDQLKRPSFEGVSSREFAKMTTHDEFTMQDENVLIYEAKEPKRRRTKIFGFVAATMAVMLGIILLSSLIYSPYSYITIDADAMVEITVSKNGKVISVSSDDKVLSEAFSAKEYKALTTDETVNNVAHTLLSKGYISSKKNVVLIGSFSKDQNEAKSLRDLVNQVFVSLSKKEKLSLKMMEYSGKVISSEKKTANSKSVSIAKLALCKKIQKKVSLVSFEHLLKYSTYDLFKLCLENSVFDEQETDMDFDFIDIKDDEDDENEKDKENEKIYDDDDKDDIDDNDSDDQEDEEQDDSNENEDESDD